MMKLLSKTPRAFTVGQHSGLPSPLDASQTMVNPAPLAERRTLADARPRPHSSYADQG